MQCHQISAALKRCHVIACHVIACDASLNFVLVQCSGSNGCTSCDDGYRNEAFVFVQGATDVQVVTMSDL